MVVPGMIQASEIKRAIAVVYRWGHATQRSTVMLHNGQWWSSLFTVARPQSTLASSLVCEYRGLEAWRRNITA